VFPPTLLPAKVQWQNYVRIWQVVPFGCWTRTSIVIATFSVFGGVLSSSLVGYSFARFRYPGRDLFFIVTLSTIMLPEEVTLIPQYLLFNKLKWLDTLKPLILPPYFGGGAFNIFLMRQFYLTIPRELDEAARMDGASSFRIYWNILLPLARPVVATVAVIAFIGHWNDFMGPLIYLNTTEKYPLSVGLRYFQTFAMYGETSKQHLLTAAALTMAAPCVLLFFAAQRYFVRGIVMSGIKG